MINIFYFWPEVDTLMYRWQRYHIFDELTHHGICIEAFNPLIYKSWEEAVEVARKQLANKRYDVFMTDMIVKDNHSFICLLHETKKLGIPSIWFRPDNLVIPYMDKHLASSFDLVWLTAKETKHYYDKWGAKTVFAPYAASPFCFEYHEMPIERKVCFIGTPYGSRTRMMNILLGNGVDLVLYYGNKVSSSGVRNEEGGAPKLYLELPTINTSYVLYKRLLFKEGRRLLLGTIKNKLLGERDIIESNHLFHENSINLDNLCYKYSQYALSLASTSAVHTDVLKNPLKIINLRNFEIPMSGGIEICRYNAELSEYFEDGKEIVFYSSNEELVDKGKYYTQKAPESELIAIKRAARKRAENEHTWYCRFKKIFQSIDLHI